jgi:hypothetical protein
MPSPPQRKPRLQRQRPLLAFIVFLLVAATLTAGLIFSSKNAPKNAPRNAQKDTPKTAPETAPKTDTANSTQNPGTYSTLLSRYLELIAHGRELRAAGDTGSAIPPLLEANRLNPSGPEGLHELAVTYEKAGYQEKANTLWAALLALGPAAEPFLAAAKSRFPTPQPDEPGQLLCIDAPLLTRDPEHTTNGTLHIPIRRKSQARVDVGSVRVEIRLYDVLPGNKVELTEADIHSRWAAFPPEWVDRSTEILEAEFRVPAPAPKAGSEQNRKFFGYVIRLYYKDLLQETRADPQDLPEKLSAPQPLRSPE